MNNSVFGRVIWVGSGKGGVGKSTLAANLACALAAKGKRVHLIDCDLQGPSIGLLMGLRSMSPSIVAAGPDQGKIIPFFKFGVHCLSMANLMDEAYAITWRGPMLQKTLERLFIQVRWPQADWTIVDLPPGTGDVPIALAQLGIAWQAVAVTTPQEVAVMDMVRAVNCWHELGVTVAALVENMCGSQPPSDFYPFGKSRLEELKRRLHIRQGICLPFCNDIRLQEELGCPIAFANPAKSPDFYTLADQILSLQASVP